MILALTGLHGSGKSHIASAIGTVFGWTVIVKRDLIKLLHDHENINADWVSWYRTLYTTIGPYEVTKKILHLIPSNGNLILDSVHNLMEWRAIQDYTNNATLASVIAPKAIRVVRNGPEDDSLDIQRIRFWHSDDYTCLASESEWGFNGAAPPEVQKAEFRAFLSHYAISE